MAQLETYLRSFARAIGTFCLGAFSPALSSSILNRGFHLDLPIHSFLPTPEFTKSQKSSQRKQKQNRNKQRVEAEVAFVSLIFVFCLNSGP